ncbi:MAG: hypothetical protein IPM25_04690 [Chloracidobacterium sp.]|nr:hypothetical protein [Chloracidobacterium sp.]
MQNSIFCGTLHTVSVSLFALEKCPFLLNDASGYWISLFSKRDAFMKIG